MRHIVLTLLVLGAGGYWVVATLRRGSLVVPPSVTQVWLSRPADGERNVLPNTFVSVTLNTGHAIDPSPDSLNTRTVRLFRASDHQPVAAQVNTSAAGDDIVLTPNQMLERDTKYTFAITGVKDLSGSDVLPFSMQFVTGGGSEASSYPVGFERTDLPGDSGFYTAITIGPDHKLYAATADGRIMRRAILPDGTLGASQIINTVRQFNDGPRLITGITFDPKSTAIHLVLWISHGQLLVNKQGAPSLVGATEWTGKISTISGQDLEHYRDVVVNLPRSWRDHLNNQIAFGPDGCAYWSQGSHTAMGAPDKKWGPDRVERLLSAAVLRLDPTKVSSDHPLDVKTPDGGGSYDPFAPGAPLTIYASGVRVAFDMLWHSNGHLYTATNGSAGGGNTPATPSDGHYPRRIDQALRGPYTWPTVLGLSVKETQPDMLLKIVQGAYYGHPNPMRAEYVLNGGNPTTRLDPYEVSEYPVGTQPDRNWHKPAYNFGTSVSPNGMLEYQSHGRFFGGALDGKILITRFSGGKDIIVLSLDANGDVTESITGIAGMTHLTQPLDIAEDERSGCLYVAEYGGEKLALLRPITDAKKLAAIKQNVFRQKVR